METQIGFNIKVSNIHVDIIYFMAVNINRYSYYLRR